MYVPVLYQAQESLPEHPTSHFLILPAELRIRIYDYVLGGNTLHSGTPGSRSDGLRYKINVCAMTKHDAASPMHNQQIHAFEPVAKRPHEYCTRSTLPPGLLKMPPLLLVSRQVSRESIVVLLGENTFTFHGPKALEIFSSKLPAHHHALIKRVRFYTLNVYDAVWPSDDTLAILLPGLTHLYAWLGINPRGTKRLPPHLMAPDETLASRGYQDRLFGHLDCFREQKLGSVRMNINIFDDVWEIGMTSDVNSDMINAWAKRVLEALTSRRPLRSE